MAEEEEVKCDICPYSAMYYSLRILPPGIRDMHGKSDKAGKAVDVPVLDVG